MDEERAGQWIGRLWNTQRTDDSGSVDDVGRKRDKEKGTDLVDELMAGSAVPACGFYVEREGKRRIKDVFYLFVLFLFWSEQ